MEVTRIKWHGGCASNGMGGAHQIVRKTRVKCLRTSGTSFQGMRIPLSMRGGLPEKKPPLLPKVLCKRQCLGDYMNAIGYPTRRIGATSATLMDAKAPMNRKRKGAAILPRPVSCVIFARIGMRVAIE